MNSRLTVLKMRTVVLIIASMVLVLAGFASGQVPLDPLTLTKFIDPLPVPGVMPQAGPNYYEIGMYEVSQQLHSQLPPTTVWGYGTSAATASFPAATIEATRGVPIQVLWTNNLPMTHLLDYAVDTTLHWANPAGPGVPTVAHLHGGENEPQSDGHPDAWFTQGFGETGPGWQQQVYNYYNSQEATTLWYHDHALGLTRLNVYAGLAGFYLLRDPAVEAPMNLPSGAYEIPMVIQDRMFNTDGSFLYPNVGVNPQHPLWQPEFFGNTILVNGVIWPHLNVEPRKYRFRILNGSNSRFYNLQLVNQVTAMPGPAFHQIGSDGGYLAAPVVLNDPANPNAQRLLIAPGERADIIIDFAGYAPGTQFVLDNNAKSPFPKGASPNPQTERPVMAFNVVASTGVDNSSITANNIIPALGPATVTRTFTLNEIMGANGPLMALINGQMWDGTLYETPQLGATEIWEFVNLTGDAHPIHLHLVQFQLQSRQKFRMNQYMKAYTAVNPVLPTDNPVAVSPAPYVSGKAMGPNPNEAGWKDTFIMYPGEVSRVIVRFAPQDGVTAFPFDATAEPGYVYHCHILEHEDNEMMRPFKVQAPAFAAAAKAEGGPVTSGLSQNYPNPFNPSTEISFALSNPGHVLLEVYNIVGQKVATLADRSYAAGKHSVTWDASALSSGIYFYRLESAEVRDTRKMVLLK